MLCVSGYGGGVYNSGDAWGIYRQRNARLLLKRLAITAPNAKRLVLATGAGIFGDLDLLRHRRRTLFRESARVTACDVRGYRRIDNVSGRLKVVREGESVDADGVETVKEWTVQLECCDLRALNDPTLTFCCHPLYFSLPLLTGWATLRTGKQACRPEVISGLFEAQAAYLQRIHDDNCAHHSCPVRLTENGGPGVRDFLMRTPNTHALADTGAVAKLMVTAGRAAQRDPSEAARGKLAAVARVCSDMLERGIPNTGASV